MSINKRVLYITYDGMTDPLGQSQVLPYLSGLAKEGYKFTILSFEKKDRYSKFREVINNICEAAGIKWVPLTFTTKPPVVAKLYDAIRMRRKAYSLHREQPFAMIHCRSYIAADIGLRMKRMFGTKFLFDMRAFWADEKKEGGSWDQSKFLFRKVYQHYKKKEADFVRNSDAIISLTHAGKREMMKWSSYNPRIPLIVIPTCSDMEHFTLTDERAKIRARELLEIPQDALVVSYLGSIGAWYMLDEMLALFAKIKMSYPGAKFLIITHSSSVQILAKVEKHSLDRSDLVITEASRDEVPIYTKASDINISFIQAVYSKISSSPTKLGEVLAMGIPVIVNSGVGDVEEIVKNSGGGIVMHEFNDSAYREVIEKIPSLFQTDPAAVREKIRPIYSLEEGIHSYSKIYSELLPGAITTSR